MGPGPHDIHPSELSLSSSLETDRPKRLLTTWANSPLQFRCVSVGTSDSKRDDDDDDDTEKHTRFFKFLGWDISEIHQLLMCFSWMQLGGALQ